MWRQKLKENKEIISQSPAYEAEYYSQKAEQLFAFKITQPMLEKIDFSNQQDPVLNQFLPHVDELQKKSQYSKDPVQDMKAQKTIGVIKKYAGRVLLICSGDCAVNCRYCFRRHFNYSQQFAPRNNWHKAVKMIEEDPSIHEVILSGGDPLTLSDKTLNHLTNQLNQIDHVKTIRIHSRIPIVLPERIDHSFCQWLKTIQQKIVFVIHCNHPNEITDKARSAIKKLDQLDIQIFNQSVLLKNINDDAKVLAQLSFTLFGMNIIPYYLHMLDKVENASHFAVSEEQAVYIHRQLKEKLPGYLVPKLAVEIAGEPYKTILQS